MTKHKVLGKTIRKIVKVGNSIGITLPREYLEAHNLKLGESMEICFNKKILRVEPLNLQKIKQAVEHGNKESAENKHTLPDKENSLTE